ncbi:hypothetical protein F5Y11DRAFT_310077 [Daldinia sp. FL1419]|nr:hypothetical protein F5Y11DRAFT_310077 [Daldinia sp. FL1419]
MNRHTHTLYLISSFSPLASSLAHSYLPARDIRIPLRSMARLISALDMFGNTIHPTHKRPSSPVPYYLLIIFLLLFT